VLSRAGGLLISSL